MNTLEVLYKAKETLTDGDFFFLNWGSCTCGHIYSAVIGRTPARVGDLDHYEFVDGMSDHPVFAEIAALFGFHGGHPDEFISSLTLNLKYRERGENSDEALRRSALKIVNEAIEKLEARYEKDRLDVLAQTKEIVNDVEIEEYAAA